MKNNMLRYKNECLFIVKKTIYSSEENKTSFYKAIDNRTKRVVGIKEIVASDKKSADELKKEINMLIMLEKYTRSTPVLYDYYVEGNTIYMIMQYIEGETLRDVFNREKETVLTEKTTKKNLMRLKKLAYALSEIHRCDGVQHKDLKPENIILSENEMNLSVIDFGLTGMGTLRGTGTPFYRAPEQSKSFRGVFRNDRIDIFSFGLIMYEALTGKRMEFMKDLVLNADGESWREIKKIDNPFVPEKLNDILRKCLSYSPENRYENGGRLVCDLRKLI